MKIISMHIYGFGKLIDVKIDNLSDFQVFYGENEAGKSTIMAFIHGILFGFPTKQQLELRYEPKHNSSYGGKLKIFTKDFGYAVIERTKGKTAAGDVKVMTNNGLMGGEDLLKKMLLNVDKQLFQSIYSFNLHGLQNIQQMKGEELGKFLLSAGTLGTERLALADMELQKELDTRFKPGGKKPLLNEKLQELHHLHRQLQDVAAKNQEYEVLVQQKERVQTEMADISEQLKEHQDQVNLLNEWKKIEPAVKEQKWINQELRLIGELSFPVRGIERFEKLKPLLTSSDAQMISLKERIDRLTKEIKEIHPNQLLLEHELEIRAELEKYLLYKQGKEQEEQAKVKLHRHEEKLAEINEKLHLTIPEEEVLAINTDIFMKDSAEKISRKGRMLDGVKEQLDLRFNEEKAGLIALEEEIKTIQAKMLPEQERKSIEYQVHEGEGRNELEVKLKIVRDKIEIYKNALQQEKKAAVKLKKQKHIQYLLLTVLFIGLIFYGFISSQAVPLILGGTGAVVVLIFLFLNLRQSFSKEEGSGMSELFKEEQQLMQQLQSYDFSKMAGLQEKLREDHLHRERLTILEIKLEEQQNQYEKVIKGFEEWELAAVEHKENIKNIARQLKIPEPIANSFLLEGFGLIEQYKSAAREKQQLLESVKRIQEIQREFFDNIMEISERFLNRGNLGIEEAVYLLKKKLNEEMERNIQWKEQHKKLSELEADYQQISEENSHLKSDLSKLLQAANVENEAEFYELGMKAEKKEKLHQRLEDLEKQLYHSFLSEMERESCLQLIDCDEIINKHRQGAAAMQTRLTNLQEQLASINYEIQMLEEGGVYSELLHQFKVKKYELEGDAKEWAVYRLAKNILMQTIEKFKSAYLPRMIQKAEEFLSFLTEGNYQRILLHEAGQGFLIVRKDQTVFEAHELSQATTEQVYVSIRLALAVTIYEKYGFPIIIDDSFVNFDHRRTKKMVELLEQLRDNQILFFTCHEHLLKHFNKENILGLNKGAVQVL